MGKQNLIILHLCIIDKDIAFYFQKKRCILWSFSFFDTIFSIFFIGLIFQQLSKLLYCSCGLFLLFLFFIFFVAFFFFGLFCFVIVIFAFCFVPTLFIDFLKLTNILHVSFFPNVNEFFLFYLENLENSIGKQSTLMFLFV